MDDAAWDRFVVSAANPSYLQLGAWRRVKAPNGWRAVRVTAAGAHGTMGAQVLVKPARPLPWSFAYAPRGPVATDWTPAAIAAVTDALRTQLASAGGRVAQLRIDPEIELDGEHDPGGATRNALLEAGWRRAPDVQPTNTRLVDLTADEDALWGGLRRKWRQYVNRARANGVTVREPGRDGIPAFYSIIAETARRVGFIIRREEAYLRTWDVLAADDLVRLLLAEGPDGDPLAALFLIRAGPRLVEPFGGMTAKGAELRANYLLKWESLVRGKAAGATAYDMWGLVSPGIAYFKAGFGGRDVQYIGTYALTFDPLGRWAFDTANRGRVWVARRRHGIAPGAEADG